MGIVHIYSILVLYSGCSYGYYIGDIIVHILCIVVVHMGILREYYSTHSCIVGSRVGIIGDIITHSCNLRSVDVFYRRWHLCIVVSGSSILKYVYVYYSCVFDTREVI